MIAHDRHLCTNHFILIVYHISYQRAIMSEMTLNITFNITLNITLHDNTLLRHFVT